MNESENYRGCGCFLDVIMILVIILLIKLIARL
uniref:Uncharacterized protein n=1 Tax=Myoviridae sp. ctfWc3 TaxID=2827697 RepID=A0A8S5SDP8_9CAUD|nr:MAG TPA: hypothetical protein [Myoviridae sp. ctfWc3]